MFWNWEMVYWFLNLGFVLLGGGGGFLEFVDVFVILGMFALFVVLAFSGIFDVFR